jgi:predicted O-methyltransferase YrrM
MIEKDLFSMNLKSVLNSIHNRFFPLWERLGIHVTPVHFYEPIPNTALLEDKLWKKKLELAGVDFNEKGQVEILSNFFRFKEEYDKFPVKKTSIRNQYFIDNKYFESVDGEVLYCMVRHFKPKKILEIGSGYSTLVSAQAILRNREEDETYNGKLIAVEPYPPNFLKGNVLGLTKLIQNKVQDIPISDFETLEEADILFIDSSHVLKIGSDVQYLFLDVLPRLQKGVIIHFHDIFLPVEYSRKLILKEHLFWTEQYLLHAFLLFNHAFQVLWAGSYMHLRHPDLLEKFFSSYNRHRRWPGSFWIRKVE